VPREPAASDLAVEIETILEPATGGQSLAKFVDGPIFPDLRESLWQSYYANLMLPELRPLDRPVLVFWIRLFQLLQALAKGEPSDAAEVVGAVMRFVSHRRPTSAAPSSARPLLESFEKIRPAVPLAVVGRRPERRREGAAPPQTDEEGVSAEALAEASRDVARLRQVRTRLDAMVAVRLSELRKSPAREGEAAGTRELPDPLAIRASDLDEPDKAFLERMGIDVTGRYATVAGAIDAAVEATLEEIDEIQEVTETAVVGGILVRRRRARADIPEAAVGAPQPYGKDRP
jgi:hypothetical protein